MQNRIVCCLLAPLVLSSCTHGALERGSFGLSKNAAAKALGDSSAYRTALVSPVRLRPGRIYNVAGGSFIEICANDFKLQRKLKSISVEKEPEKNEIAEDDVFLNGVEAQALGFTLGPTYFNKIKVTGYQNQYAVAPTNAPLTTYILNNVGRDRADSCAVDVLPSNKPYFVVERTSVGKKVETYRKIGLAGAAKIGGIGVSNKSEEKLMDTRTSVVFGATGLLVE